MTALPDRQIGLFHQIVESSSTAILVLDNRLQPVYANPAAEMLFAFGTRHLCSQPLDALLIDSRELKEALHDALVTAHPFTQRELRLTLPPEPRVLTVDCTVTPLGERPAEGALLVEMLQIDRHLRISREENLLVQQQAARALLRGLAHEIKNPLGGLRGAAQLLERELSDEGLREYTRVIISEADRLRNLVNRMLGPSGMVSKRRLNIHEVVERVRQLVSAEAAPGVRIERDYDPSIPDLEADGELLIQALLNIVRNAVEAVGDRGKIILRTRTQRHYTIGPKRYKLVACIDVIDDGPGIAPELLEQIFLPMVTGRAQGTGLGLSIAQSLINQHHGLIECSSRPGCTKFTLLLPLDATDEKR